MLNSISPDDLKILNATQAVRGTIEEAGKTVGLSQAQASRRFKALVGKGYVIGQRYVLSRANLGMWTAYATLDVRGANEEALGLLSELIRKQPEVVAARRVLGERRLILEVAASDHGKLEHLLCRIAGWPGVHDVEVKVCKTELKHDTALPLSPAAP